jgi:hypothetical protein
MAYMVWNIGGLTPSWVEPDFKHDKENKTLTLKCAAIYDVIGEDPISEIESFDAISSERIFTNDLANGGTNLQVTNGQIITVTASNLLGNKIKTWDRCALQAVNVNLDSFYNEANPGSVIEYELVIKYALRVGGGVSIYTPPYNQYSNVECYFWTDKTNTGSGPEDNSFTEIGYMKITEPKNVKLVEVYGSACIGGSTPANYLDMNGDKQYWHYSHDQGWESNLLPMGWEKLTFKLNTPTKEVVLQTPNHILPNNNYETNLGCWLQWVRLLLE